MKKYIIKQESHSDTEADHPAPKLYLVKGGSKPASDNATKNLQDIYEQVGLSHPKEIEPSSTETNETEKSPQHIQAIVDVEQFRAGKIKATELRKRHPETYKNWSGMKQRCKADPQTGISPVALHSSFVKFADFLAIMGPRPLQSWSLDRINPTGPYSPDNVRWASKTTQARNRTNTVYLAYKGQTLPLVEWAEMNDENPDTYRMRKRSGWTDEEIIEGCRSSPASFAQQRPQYLSDPFDYTPWPREVREKMEGFYQRERWRQEHRLAFMKRYAAKQLDNFTKVAEDVSWPDCYTPTQDEELWAKQLAEGYNKWHRIFLDARRKLSESYSGQRYRKPSLPDSVEAKLRAYA